MNVDTLCQAVVDTSAKRCPALVPKAELIKKTFKKALDLFAKCRVLYDSSKVFDDEDISTLGNI